MATPDDIKAAESIVGVAYTDRERLQILEVLESQLVNYHCTCQKKDAVDNGFVMCKNSGPCS